MLFDAPGPEGRRRNAVIAVIGALAILALLSSPGPGAGRQGPADRGDVDPVPRSGDLDGLPHCRDFGPRLIAAAISLVSAIDRRHPARDGPAVPLAPVRGGLRRLRGVLPLRASADDDAFRLLLLPLRYCSLRRRPSAARRHRGPDVLQLVRHCRAGPLRRRLAAQGSARGGLAIGLTPSPAADQRLLPQAITAMLPSIISQLVVILKDSALGYSIFYPELLRSGRTLATLQGQPDPHPDRARHDLHRHQLRADQARPLPGTPVADPSTRAQGR